MRSTLAFYCLRRPQTRVALPCARCAQQCHDPGARKFSRFGWVDRAREKKTLGEMIRHLKVRTPSLEQPVQFLSGGNQQKGTLTRPHLRETGECSLAYEPTQGGRGRTPSISMKPCVPSLQMARRDRQIRGPDRVDGTVRSSSGECREGRS